MQRKVFLILLALLAILLAACDNAGDSGGGSTGSIPANAIQIEIVYAPESDDYMLKIISDFNESYRNNINPVTGEGLTGDEKPIYVTGRPGSSGTVMQGIVNAVTNTAAENVERPTVFQPSVSHWLALANFQSRREIFDLTEIQPTALAPVVMAIWESRLEAIQKASGTEDIGWEELLQVFDSENGWLDYGISNGRRTVYYGHTDPFVSSTALSTLIAEYYASARVTGFTGRRLTLDVVKQEDVREGVRNIESLIRHYSRRTTEFKNYIAQGPDYLDFVALEENDLIAINRGQTQYQPPEKLVALYPKEGTFWHEHPLGIVNADWVTAEQKEAARVFGEYLLLPDNQEYIMSFGFRPANPDVELGFPFEDANGVTIEGPANVLDVPESDVISEIQNSWEFVKKQADVWLLIDVSGSMEAEGKLDQAKIAATTFLDNLDSGTKIGLAMFSEQVIVLTDIDFLETNEAQMRQQIESLRAEGGTALYDALEEIVTRLNEDEDTDRIRAVVVLSDGEDTQSVGSLDQAVRTIEASYNALNPVIVVPVGYGTLSDELIRVLNRIASASSTTWQSGDPSNIRAVLELISSFF